MVSGGDSQIEKLEGHLIRSNMPTSSTDTFNLAHRGDGAILLSMLSLLPDNIQVENHRTLISADTAKGLIDALSEILDHYPKKPRKPRVKKTK